MPSRRENESILLKGAFLGDLSFDWIGDRYQHCWRFADFACSIASIESNNTEIWPDSPPVQQIHQQAFGDGRDVVFGVGMSGRGHWSASFTLVAELHSWIVELACRSPVEPARLVASYDLSGNWREDANKQIRCEHEAATISLEPIAPGCEATLDVVEESDSKRVRFQPTSIGEGSVTTQWAFRLRVEQRQ